MKTFPKTTFDSLKLTIQNDIAYAWTWQCNLAMAMYDEGIDHETANRIAARIVSNFFEVDITNTPQFQALEDGWKNNEEHQSLKRIREQKKQTHQLGVIKSIQFGMGDRDEPCILMVVKTIQGEALLSFFNDDIMTFVKRADAQNINNLVGKPCVVEINDGIMKFVEMFK